MVPLHRCPTGIALVAISAVLWSRAGLFVRMADLDTWSIVVWRSGFAFLTLGAVAVFHQRGKVLRCLAGFGTSEAVTVAVAVASTIAYVTAFRLTSVANVVTVYATLPFIAGGIAFFWLGERVTRRFLFAGTVAVAGVATMAGAVATARDILGITASVVMTSGFATQLVHAKRHPTQSTSVSLALAALVCIPFSLPFAQAGVPTPHQILACALDGMLTTGLAYILALEGGG